MDSARYRAAQFSRWLTWRWRRRRIPGGSKAVTQNSTISYLRPGSGRKLRAVATEVSRGRRTGLYEVEVRGENGKLVAKIMSGVFISEERFDFFPAEKKEA